MGWRQRIGTADERRQRRIARVYRAPMEPSEVAEARRAWDRGDAVFVVRVQAATLLAQRQTDLGNAGVVNGVVRLGWVVQGTQDRVGGRRVVTFVRPSGG